MKNFILSLFTMMIFISLDSMAIANSIQVYGNISNHNGADSVDHWNINLSEQSSLTLNVLAKEYKYLGDGNHQYLDFFDGIIGNDQLDSIIYLFTFSGSLIGMNVNSSEPGWDSDGSINEWDAFLTIDTLSSGDYILAIGDEPLTQAQAWNGYNTDNPSQFYTGNYPSGIGKYQITFFANIDNLTVTPRSIPDPIIEPVIEPVPGPTAILLLGPGLIGLAGLRRKLRKNILW